MIHIWGNCKEKLKNVSISFRIVVILGWGGMDKHIKHQGLYLTCFAIKISVSVLLKGTCSDSFS